MNFAIEVVHQERAEEREVLLLAEMIEEVFQLHTRRDVPALPQDVDHLAPPTYRRVAPPSARLTDDVRGEPEEYGRIRHPVPQEMRQELVCVNYCQLPASPGGCHIHAFGLEARAKRVPVSGRRHQDDALSVRDSSTGKPADGPVEEILVLIELDDVI